MNQDILDKLNGTLRSDAGLVPLLREFLDASCRAKKGKPEEVIKEFLTNALAIEAHLPHSSMNLSGLLKSQPPCNWRHGHTVKSFEEAESDLKHHLPDERKTEVCSLLQELKTVASPHANDKACPRACVILSYLLAEQLYAIMLEDEKVPDASSDTESWVWNDLSKSNLLNHDEYEHLQASVKKLRCPAAHIKRTPYQPPSNVMALIQGTAFETMKRYIFRKWCKAVAATIEELATASETMCRSMTPPVRTKWIQQGGANGPLLHQIGDESELSRRGYLRLQSKIQRNAGKGSNLKGRVGAAVHRVARLIMRRYPRNARYGTMCRFQGGTIYWIEARWRRETGAETIAVDSNSRVL